MASFQAICKSCGASNRIPAEKEGIAGKCGNCHQPLPALYWQPQQLNERSFDNFVAAYHGPILAEFWAPW